MLLRRFNKSCLQVIALNATEAERPFYVRSRIYGSARNTKTTAQLLASVLSSHARLQILDSSYQFN